MLQNQSIFTAGTTNRRLLSFDSRLPVSRAQTPRRHFSLVLYRPSNSLRHSLCGLRHISCRSSATDGRMSTASRDTDERLATTIADLDALLGIENEVAASESKVNESPSAADAAGIEELQSAVTAEVQKLAQQSSDTKANADVERSMTDHMRKIVERAKRLTDYDDAERQGQKAALQQEFEQLLNMFFNGENSMDKADIKKLQESGVFGPLTFWVTEFKNLEGPGVESAGSGVLIRGNLRADRLEVFNSLCAKVKELFGSKYSVLMIEDPEAEEDGSAAAWGDSRKSGKADRNAAAAAQQPKVAFQVVLTSEVTPPQTTGWKVVVATILLLLLVASSVQLSLVANITKLPKETLEYLASPDNLNTDALPPGLADWDPSSYLASAIPIAVSIIGVNFVHEVGHRIAAFVRKVKLGPTFFIPNLQIGSFGGITPIQSLLKNRSDLWDVAAAGPVAGITASVALLVIGLSQSQPGELPQELLVPVPSQLFQGSLLLGTLTRLALGSDALARPDILISPLVVAGWCGLITNALNLLPVGSLDGGRMMQAAFGVQALSLSAFFTYVGLGLGLLGSSLSLPFGLYVLICQRTAEKYIQDNVSPVSGTKQTATAIAVLTAILILVPMAPEVAQLAGVGTSTNLFM